MTFLMKYGPAPCDKKCCSEHQTLLTLFPLFKEGLGTRLVKNEELEWGWNGLERGRNGLEIKLFNCWLSDIPLHINTPKHCIQTWAKKLVPYYKAVLGIIMSLLPWYCYECTVQVNNAISKLYAMAILQANS